MSVFEGLFVVYLIIVFFGAMFLDDAGAWFSLQLINAIISLPLWAYSSVNSPLYETYSRPVQVSSQFEVPNGMLVYYLDFNGKSQRAEYTQYEDVRKLKNGATLHLTTNHGWVNFGPDKETIEVKIK